MKFDQPQRQSAMGMAVESGLILFKLIKGLWPVLLVMYLRLESINMAYLAGIILIVLVLICIFGYLTYRNTSFYIEESSGEFILNRGILNKQRVVVSLARIQQVNINQDFVHKIFDIYSVAIETAGSSKSEAVINAISRHTARALQSRLLESSASADLVIQSETTERPKPFIRIGIDSLFKIGITSRYLESLSLLIAFFYAIYSNARDIWWSGEEDEQQLNVLIGSFFTLQAIGVFLGGFIIVILLFNLIRTLITYYGFTISQLKQSLMISYGLFNTRNTLIRPAKVQITKVTQNFFQRKMDLSQLTVHQPSSDIQLDKKAKIAIPGCNSSEEKKLMNFLYGRQPEKGYAIHPHWRKMLPGFLVFVLLPLIIYLLIHHYSALPAYTHGFALFYLCLAACMIYLSYRNARLFISTDFIIRQSGIWDITTEYLEPHKIQAITSKQLPWHRKNDIGHITLHTAGGDLAFRFGNFSGLQALKNQWLFQVESSGQEWM